MIPLIVKVAPPLVIGVAIFLALKELFSSDEVETKLGATPNENRSGNLLRGLDEFQ